MGGGVADTNGWFTVLETTSNLPLENVEHFKAHYSGAFAVTTDTKYYTWVSRVYLGNGSVQTFLAKATKMTIP